ncbi:MAG TPA: protein-disulfide reductase DsbD domain-containing protein [Pirellulales bacterium]|nr:protein-disulfide reductase DsbD domain-containing protein [Pirellulales bacterium]
MRSFRSSFCWSAWLLCCLGCGRPTPAATPAVPLQEDSTPPVVAAPSQAALPVAAETAEAPTQGVDADDVEVDEPVGHKPVAAGVILAPSKLTAPDTATLLIRVKTAPGWHIYAVGQPAGTSQPTRLELSLPEGLEPDGDWVYPEAVAGGGNAIYEGDFSFRRRLRLTEAAQPGRLKVGCQIAYQACDPFSCRPPETLRVETAVEVVSNR